MYEPAPPSIILLYLMVSLHLGSLQDRSLGFTLLEKFCRPRLYLQSILWKRLSKHAKIISASHYKPTEAQNGAEATFLPHICLPNVNLAKGFAFKNPTMSKNSMFVTS